MKEIDHEPGGLPRELDLVPRVAARAIAEAHHAGDQRDAQARLLPQHLEQQRLVTAYSDARGDHVPEQDASVVEPRGPAAQAVTDPLAVPALRRQQRVDVAVQRGCALLLGELSQRPGVGQMAGEAPVSPAVHHHDLSHVGDHPRAREARGVSRGGQGETVDDPAPRLDAPSLEVRQRLRPPLPLNPYAAERATFAPPRAVGPDREQLAGLVVDLEADGPRQQPPGRPGVGAVVRGPLHLDGEPIGEPEVVLAPQAAQAQHPALQHALRLGLTGQVSQRRSRVLDQDPAGATPGHRSCPQPVSLQGSDAGTGNKLVTKLTRELPDPSEPPRSDPARQRQGFPLRRRAYDPPQVAGCSVSTLGAPQPWAHLGVSVVEQKRCHEGPGARSAREHPAPRVLVRRVLGAKGDASAAPRRCGQRSSASVEREAVEIQREPAPRSILRRPVLARVRTALEGAVRRSEGGTGARPALPQLVPTLHTWILSTGWRRHGLVSLDAVPGAGKRFSVARWNSSIIKARTRTPQWGFPFHAKK